MSLLRFIFSFVLLVNLTRAVELLKTVDVLENKEILPSEVKIDYRLPTNVRPTYYRIKLDPDISNKFNFSGESSINITVTDSLSNTIILHSKNLTYDKTVTSLSDPTGKIIATPNEHLFDNVTDFLNLTFAKTIRAGDYTLKLKYNGTLIHDDYNGFYRSSYKNDQGNDVWLAMTQFQPTHARSAFPCFDEPAKMAKFEISIKHFENYTVVSNMPALSRARDKDDFTKWWTNFDVTPNIPTYHVAFIISNFNYSSNPEQTFRVWSRDSATHLGEYAQAIGQVVLKQLKNYTGNQNLIPKMDNFAVPHSVAGPMGNWGLVTYRESQLLFDESITSAENKQSIAMTMSRGFVHQWFGNLVSPKWWDFIWLNEGIANYFEYFITDKAEPTWHLMDQFVIKNLQETAFGADDNSTQHPMDAMVKSPAEISKNFDSISYNKAGCVIRMISHALTETVFQHGLTTYLNTWVNFELDSSHLLYSLTYQINLPNAENVYIAFQSWFKRAGYPVVTIIRDYETEMANITQKRFLTKKLNQTHEETWGIPFNYATQSSLTFDDTRPERWVTKNQPATMILSGLKTNEWLIVNKQQTGYYRVNYDVKNWKLIAKYLNSPQYYLIHKLNRAQLLDDSFKLAEAGELEDYTIFFEISAYLQNEDDYVPWYVAHRAFSVLNKALENTIEYDQFKLWVLRLLEKLENSVGYVETAEDDHVTKLNRINAIDLACTMGSKNCLDATQGQVIDYVFGLRKISTDLRSVVLCSGLRTAGAEIWDFTYRLIAGGQESPDKIDIMNALGCSSNVEKLNFYLTMTLMPGSTLTRGDVIKAVYVGSPVGVDVVFDFLRENHQVIIVADGGMKSLVGYFAELGSRMTTIHQIDKLEKFIKSLKNNGNEKLAVPLMKESLARAKANIDWLNKYEPQIITFLEAHKSPAGETGGSNISLPTITLTAFMILITSMATWANGL